eukprot:2684195-Pyramimonas_sp.AAC.1
MGGAASHARRSLPSTTATLRRTRASRRNARRPLATRARVTASSSGLTGGGRSAMRSAREAQDQRG